MSFEAKSQGKTLSEGAQPASNPLVSVILVCRWEVEHIKTVLESILAQEETDGGFEVIIADGMSDDGTREILEEIANSDSRVKMIDNPGRIASTGLNAAIRAARGQIIIRMDAHTHYAPDYMRQCVSVLRSSGADNVGGPWVARETGYLGEAIAASFQSPFALGGARAHRAQYEGPVDTVYLGCWRRDAFLRFGEFDEGLVRNQDDEHNLRIVRGGGTVWQSPKIRCWYHPRNTLRGLFRQYNQYGYWKVKVIQKHKRPASPRHLVPGAFLLTLMLLCLAWGLCVPATALLQSTAALGAAAAFVRTSALFLLWGLLSVYAFGLALASLLTACRTKLELLPILPVVFCCYHFGYGWGFLFGVYDLVICRRLPDPRFGVLTR